MTGPDGWGVLEQVTAAGHARPVAVTDTGYGDNTTFRLELDDRHWQYVLAVKGTTSAYAGDARPVTRTRAAVPVARPGPSTPARRGAAPARHRPRGPGPPGDLAAGHQDHPR